MTTPHEHRPTSPLRRAQLSLILLILWDLVAILSELSFRSTFFEVDGDKISGLLGARGSFSGASLVPLMIYVYALVRGPLRHTNVFWVAALEMAAACLFAVYHVAADDIEVKAMFVPLIISGALLAFVLMNLPRGERVAA